MIIRCAVTQRLIPLWSDAYWPVPGLLSFGDIVTVVTEIGFRFLHFVYSARTGAGKALYYIGSSVLQGWCMGLKSGEITSCATRASTYLFSIYFETFTTLWQLRFGRPPG
jgi:hypothetical protein